MTEKGRGAAAFATVLFSCHWFIYKTISGLNEMHLAEKTEQGLRLQIDLQKEHYGAIDEKVKADQIFRHDLRHYAKLLRKYSGQRGALLLSGCDGNPWYNYFVLGEMCFQLYERIIPVAAGFRELRAKLARGHIQFVKCFLSASFTLSDM